MTEPIVCFRWVTQAITARAIAPPLLCRWPRGYFRCHLFFSGRAAPTGDLQEKRVEPIGRFVLGPMPRSRDHLEPGAWLDIAQCAGAIVEMGVGGRVSLTPDPVDARLDER